MKSLKVNSKLIVLLIMIVSVGSWLIWNSFIQRAPIVEEPAIIEKPINDRSCHTYTIYPFPNKPSSPTQSKVGVYIHAPDEPTGCGAKIEHKIATSSGRFVISLGKTTYSRVCPDVVGANKVTPNARVILGKLDIGMYDVDVETCGHIDKYRLRVENNRLAVEVVDSKYGRLLSKNNGIYKW